MKILLINLMPAIGEFLFITPALKAIRRAYPDAQIEVLIANQNDRLCIHNPNLDRVMTFDKRGPGNSLSAHLQLIRSLRREKYDRVINLNPTERVTLIALLSGAKSVEGFAIKGLGWLFSRRVPKINRGHCVTTYLRCLQDLEIPVLDAEPMEVHVNLQTRERVQRLWDEAGLGDCHPVIGIHPGANWAIKRWPAESMAELSDSLHKTGMKTVFFGGSGDLATVGRISDLCEQKPVVFTGKLDLLELTDMIGRCDVFVSNDSGPLHIAASQQIPVVGLYGPTFTKRYGPYHVRHHVVRSDSDCPPCNRLGCKDNRCMRMITPAQVQEAIISILAGGGTVTSG